MFEYILDEGKEVLYNNNKNISKTYQGGDVMRRAEDTNIISLKSRRNKKKYKKFYDFIESIKSAFFSKRDNCSPNDPLYKKPANN